MTWSYSGDPDGEPKDEVRWMVGDTDSAEELVQDEEIEYILGPYPKVEGRPNWIGAAQVADAIAAKFARRANRSIGSLSISAKQQRDHYRELANDLRALHASNGVTTTPGGMSSIKPASPVLSGGGRTYLGGSSYDARDTR